MIFQTISRFVIFFSRLILGKAWLDGLTRPRRENEVRYEFDLKNFKRFRVKKENFAVLFVWISKQQLNLPLFLSVWYWQKLGLTNLPSRYGKEALDKEMTCNSYWSYQGGHRVFGSHFSVIFETPSKFVIVFVRLILGKLWVDRFTGPRWKINIRYRFDLKVI